MAMLCKTLRVVVSCGVLGTGLTAVLASGCGGDDSAVAPGPDASTDVAQQEASLQDATQPDTTTHDAMPDATVSDGGAEASDGTVADASDAGDATVADASDSGAASDADASDASDASDADASDGDASDAADAADASVPACLTTVGLLGGDAGDADAGPTPQVLFAFDDAADAGLQLGSPGFSPFSDPGSLATLTLNPGDGHPCAGSLSLNATYTAFGPKSQAYYNYGPTNPQDWTGYTTFHVWLKVVTSDYSTISGVEPRVDSSNYTLNLFDGFVNGTTLSDGGWHETIVHLTPSANYLPSAVSGFQLELQSQGTPVDGGPLGPPPATLLIDSFWIE